LGLLLRPPLFFLADIFLPNFGCYLLGTYPTTYQKRDF
jgi:hypothetical protein